MGDGNKVLLRSEYHMDVLIIFAATASRGCRFSMVKYQGTKKLCSTWEQKLEKKFKRQQMKELENEINARKKKEKQVSPYMLHSVLYARILMELLIY